jgi:fucose permease
MTTGQAVGRVALLWVNKKVGERPAIYLYTLIAIGLELVVWLVPSLIGGSVAVAFVGVFLGPVYPIAINVASEVLPAWLITGCIGWIAGFGQAGSAVFPFLTGTMANSLGIKSLQPLYVIL